MVRQPALRREPGSRWWPRVLDIQLLASFVLPALLFAGVAAYDRTEALGTAKRDLLATLDTIQGHAEKVFQLQAIAIGAVTERLGSQSDEEIRAARASHHAFLRNLRQHANESLGIVIFSAEGHPLVESARSQPPEHLDVSDREYFRWHRDHPETQPYMAGPVRSRGGSGTVFFMTARRSAPDGSFLGVVAVGIQQSTFLDYWNRAALGPGEIVNLSRNDDVILARRPPVEVTDGSRIARTAPLAQAISSGAERRVVKGISPLDGVDRLIAYRRVGPFPVNIAYGVPRAAALGRWYERLAIYGGFALLTSLTLASLALLSRRRHRELHDLNASLEQRVAQRTAEIQASEAQVRLLAREVDHRAKNALAVVLATLQLTPRSDAASYAKAVEGRVTALARAQTLLSEDRWRGVSLHALLKAELAPFVTEGLGEAGPRADLDGPSVLLPAIAAQPVAMVAHELATNAVKHGALSTPGGRVSVSWWLARNDDEHGATLLLRWAELNGPLLAAPPTRRGFGTRVLVSTVRGQLRGQISLSWMTSGLICEIEVPLARLAQDPAHEESAAA
jgi:two-component sensor histidine kinase